MENDLKMKKQLRILLVITVLIAALISSAIPSWWLVEKWQTRDFSSTSQIQNTYLRFWFRNRVSTPLIFIQA